MDACNEGDFSKVRKLLDEGRVSVHDTTEEGESLLSLACSAGYYELAQVSFKKTEKTCQITADHFTITKGQLISECNFGAFKSSK